MNSIRIFRFIFLCFQELGIQQVKKEWNDVSKSIVLKPCVPPVLHMYALPTDLDAIMVKYPIQLNLVEMVPVLFPRGTIHPSIHGAIASLPVLRLDQSMPQRVKKWAIKQGLDNKRGTPDMSSGIAGWHRAGSLLDFNSHYEGALSKKYSNE